MASERDKEGKNQERFFPTHAQRAEDLTFPQFFPPLAVKIIPNHAQATEGEEAPSPRVASGTGEGKREGGSARGGEKRGEGALERAIPGRDEGAPDSEPLRLSEGRPPALQLPGELPSEGALASIKQRAMRYAWANGRRACSMNEQSPPAEIGGGVRGRERASMYLLLCFRLYIFQHKKSTFMQGAL